MADDDDWVGTPPEGRVARERSNPGFWQQDFPAVRWVFGILFLMVAVVVLLALL